MKNKRLDRILNLLFKEKSPRTGRLDQEDARTLATAVELKVAAQPGHLQPTPAFRRELERRLRRELANETPRLRAALRGPDMHRPLLLRPRFRPVLAALATLAALLVVGGLWALPSWLGGPPKTEIVLNAPLPTTYPTELTLYYQLSLTVSLDEVRELAARLGLSGTIVSDDSYWIVQDGTRELQVQRNTRGRYLYSDSAVDPGSCPDVGLTQEEAWAIAEEYLSSRGLLPDAYQVEPPKWNGGCAARFVALVDGLPARERYVDLDLGREGTITGIYSIYSSLPPLEPAEMVPVRSPEDALHYLQEVGLEQAGSMEWQEKSFGEIFGGVSSSLSGDGDEGVHYVYEPIRWPFGEAGTTVTLTGTLGTIRYRGEAGRPWTVHLLILDDRPHSSPILVGSLQGIEEATGLHVRIWGQVLETPPVDVFMGEFGDAPVVAVERWERTDPDEHILQLFGRLELHEAWGGAELVLTTPEGEHYVLNDAFWTGIYYEADRVRTRSEYRLDSTGGIMYPIALLARTTDQHSLLSGYPVVIFGPSSSGPHLAGAEDWEDVPARDRPRLIDERSLEEELAFGYPRVEITSVTLLYRADPLPLSDQPGGAATSYLRPAWAFSGTAKEGQATFTVYVDASVQTPVITVTLTEPPPLVQVDTHAVYEQPLEELLSESQWVLLGRVEAVHPARWNTPNGKEPLGWLHCQDIVREVDLIVEQYWLGPEIGDRVTIAVTGGLVEYQEGSTHGSRGMWCPEPQQSFAVGDRVVVLARDIDGDGLLEVPGAARARYFVTDQAEAVATYGVERMALEELRERILEIKGR